MEGPFIAYYRVSTQQQGRSGLGLEAQRAGVGAFLGVHQAALLGEFTEVETAKGSNALEKRPQLRTALTLCKSRKATLLVAKLDRLARNVHFLSGLMESGVRFVAVDMPDVNRLTVHVLAAVAEHEREVTSLRTREALAAAKARGVKLGQAGPRNLKRVNDLRHEYAQSHAEMLRSVLHGMRSRGLSQRDMAAEINALGIRAPRGGLWHLATVQRVLARLDGDRDRPSGRNAGHVVSANELATQIMERQEQKDPALAAKQARLLRILASAKPSSTGVGE